LLRRTITSLVCAAALAAPVGNAWATATAPKALPKKKVITVKVTGPAVPCKRWGPLAIAIKVQKTVTTAGARTSVKLKILDVTWPIVSDATFRTIYINKQALPLLREEVLEIQAANVEVIAGATDTTVSFKQSLQAALLQAKKP
jgi:hypothetical protein